MLTIIAMARARMPTAVSGCAIEEGEADPTRMM